MDDKIKSALSFGILLILVGIIGRYLHWKQGNTLIFMGLLFEFYALGRLIWKQYKNKK